MAMSSYEYWKKREDLNRKAQIRDQKRREEWLRDTYEDMMKSCTDQIEAFYARYAHRNGITIAEARKRVAEMDIKAYSRKARKYVKEKDFSETANEEMALYNLTMKVNRLEMLKAQMNLELTAGFDSVDKYFKGELKDAALDEYKRMAGILGKTVQNPTRRAESLVNASFKNATFSQRIWQHHNALINTLSTELTNALIQGKHPRDLAKIVASKFGVYRYAAERLMITEVARVQTGAQKEAYERNGYGEYVFITEAKPCPDCAKLAGQQFKLKDMQPGENAPPMHPICRCSTAAAMDQDEFEKWLAGKEEDRKMLSRGEAAEKQKGSIEFDNRVSEQQKELIQKLADEYDTHLERVTIGAEKAAGDVDITGSRMRLSDKHDYTAIHEFAHTLANTSADKYGLTQDQEFWKEIKRIRRKYMKDVENDPSRWISAYEHSGKSIDEFMAEAFTHAKMQEMGLPIPKKYGSDFTYSQRVLEAVNKFFNKDSTEHENNKGSILQKIIDFPKNEFFKSDPYEIVGSFKKDLMSLFEEKVGSLQTDEVIIMEERLKHIKSRHPEDYELFGIHGEKCIFDPDMIIKDDTMPGTVLLIKQIENTNLNAVTRLALTTDEQGYKNSIITFHRIRKKSLKNKLKKGRIIYKKSVK